MASRVEKSQACGGVAQFRTLFPYSFRENEELSGVCNVILLIETHTSQNVIKLNNWKSQPTDIQKLLQIEISVDYT